MNGIEIIAAERKRQIEQEGWSAEHDDQNTNGELANAAACYAIMPRTWSIIRLLWPFHIQWWKPCRRNRVKELAKAGALIAAEIDRIKRKKDNR